MQLPDNTASTAQFVCNICGAANAQPVAGFHRELAQCTACGANARFRGVIRALALALGLAPRLPLKDWPRRKQVRGIGMSDWPGYARLLAERFDYTNTYYDRAPRLDIQSPPAEMSSSCDFVISTDVFEHILPPLQDAFDNLHRLLKPGGTLVFSVPYTREAQTLEHFRDLNEFDFYEFRGQRILVNRDRGGQLAAYGNLVFHGGEGATLEMRMFCESDLIERLKTAGFTDIVVHGEPDLAVGYYWPPLPQADPAAPPLYAYIITARRP